MMKNPSRSWATAARMAFAAGSALAVLSACTVGPDFRTPAPVSSRHYDRRAEQELGAEGSGDAPRIDFSRAVAGDWWAEFRSPKLDQMMRAAIAGNNDLAAADATIAEADEYVTAARGGLRPQLDFGASGGGQGAGGASSGVYTVGPSVSFDFDIFGGKKRLVEERSALAGLQRHRYDSAYLTLTGDVARQAFILASARAQIRAVETLLAQDRQTLRLVSLRHQIGSATMVDVTRAQTQLAQDQTLLPPLAQQRDTARHAIAVLAGRAPADWTPPDFEMTDLVLPASLPVSLPSELARDRPDILEAEARLHAASAAIGVATADLYPHLQLSGSLAAAGPGFGALWSAFGGLTAPLFHGGTLKADRRASVDAYNAALATYRQTVVRSLGQVADVLQAINHDSEEYDAQQQAFATADAGLRLNQAGYRAGETDILQVLDAQRSYQRALLGRIRARTAQYLDTVQLSVALGGNAAGAFARSRAS